MPSLFERLAESVLGKMIKEVTKAILKKEGKKPSDKSSKTKSHPWRLCPLGEHWVKTHPLKVPESSKAPERQTTRHGHCRTTLNSKELCTADELKEIAQTCFEPLGDDPNVMPIPDALGFSDGNKYDLLIAGWTKFWNETLNLENPVTPDFVKALIASESDFKILPDTSSKDGAARGLVQITEATRVIMQNPKGELKDYLINMTSEESRDPEVNISAGVRWLYHKRYLLKSRLKRDVTWEEAAAEYKGIFNDIGKNKKTDRIMRELKSDHKRLAKQRESKKK